MWLTKFKDQTGATLVEMLMVMFIMSILTAAALPQLKKQSIRTKESQMRSDLVSVRKAIDDFHIDWRKGEIAQTGSFVSADGYPRNWDALTEGVPATEGATTRRYLRVIPVNPFATDPAEPWLLLGHTDQRDSETWNGVDIFDLRANTDHVALNGTQVSDW